MVLYKSYTALVSCERLFLYSRAKSVIFSGLTLASGPHAWPLYSASSYRQWTVDGSCEGTIAVMMASLKGIRYGGRHCL